MLVISLRQRLKCVQCFYRDHTRSICDQISENVYVRKLVGLLGITDAQHAKLKHQLNRNTGETFIDIP